MRFIHIKNSSFEFSSSICAGVTSASAVWGIVVFKHILYPLLKFYVWMHDKIANLAGWWHTKILIPANFIVSYCNQSQKIKPIVSQNAGHRWARTHMHTILVSLASFVHSAHIEPLRANTQSRCLISAASSRSLP